MNSFVIGRRLIKEIGNDKRTVAMLFIAPIFILTLFYVVLNTKVEHVNLGVMSEPMITMNSEEVKLVEYSDEDAMKQGIIDHEIDGYLVIDGQQIRLVVEGTEPSIDSKVVREIQTGMMDSLETIFSKLPMKIEMFTMEVEPYFGKELSNTFESIAPFMMGYVVFFLVFLLSGIAFLRERISGTMTRMMSTSVRRTEIVIGYILGFGFFALMQTIVIQLYITQVLGIPNRGNFFLVLLINVAIAGGSLTLGILLSAFARNEFQLFQFIPIVIIPQTLFAGLFPLRDAHPIILALSKCFPLKYAADALRDVMLRGEGFSAVYKDIIILFLFMAFFLALNIRVLRKYRNT